MKPSIVNRSRDIKWGLWLNDTELETLNAKSQELGMSKSEYIRNIIMFGSTREITNFSKEDTRKIIYELNRIGNNINQIAYRVNSSKEVNDQDIVQIQDEMGKIIDLYFDMVEE